MFFCNTRRRKLLLLVMLSIGIGIFLPNLSNNVAKASGNNNVATQSAISATVSSTEKPKTSQEVTQKNTKKKKKYLYSKGYIKVRKKASKNSQKKFLLKAGQRVQVLKEGKSWVKIRRLNKTGYVLKRYLTSNKKKAISSSKKTAESFKLTGYCACYECSEGWGRSTKSGRKAKANHTVAADLSVLPLYTEVYIDGMGEYTVEDKGGGVRGKHIDVFCNAHNQCLRIKSRAKVSLIMG